MADFGRRVDEPALRRHMRDRDQLGARTDRAFERLKVDRPRCGVVYDVDLYPNARPYLQERKIIREVLGPRGDDAVARPQRNPRRTPCPRRAWRSPRTRS